MINSKNKLKKKAARILMIIAGCCFLLFIGFFFALNVGMYSGYENFYNSTITMFTLDAFSRTRNLVFSIATYVAIALCLAFFISLAAKKLDDGLKSRGIIYTLIILVVSVISLSAVLQCGDALIVAYKNTFVSKIYGKQTLTMQCVLLAFVGFGALFAILSSCSVIVCLTGGKKALVQEQPAVEEKKEEAAPAVVEEKKEEPVKEEPKQEPVKEEVKPEPAKEVKEEPAPAPVEEKKEEPIKEEPIKEEPVKQEVKPEPVKEEVKPEPAKVEPAPAVIPAAPKKKYDKRVPFDKRIKTMDPEVKKMYKEIKDEIEAYGIKSRISVSGDTYRLHTVKYLKITVAGKKLKLYYKLDPKKYKDSTIPVGDVSAKKVFADTPCSFKVKSDLSLKRAKGLIKDMMDEAHIAKKEEKKA